MSMGVWIVSDGEPRWAYIALCVHMCVYVCVRVELVEMENFPQMQNSLD